MSTSPTSIVRTTSFPIIQVVVAAIVSVAFIAIAYLAFTSHTAKPRFVHPAVSPYVLVTTVIGHGSGVGIGDGYIITAAHVVDDPAGNGIRTLETTIQTDNGAEQPGEVLWSSKKYDIALVHVSKYPVGSAPLLCDDNFAGQKVKAYGNPLILQFIYTTGEVNGSKRQFGDWPEAVPMSISVAPGQSGGGVIDDKGNVVGIAVGALTSDWGMPALGVMVPASTVCMLLDRQ